MKSIIAICVALCVFGALASDSTNSPGSFLRGPFVVLNAATGGNATDIASWSTGNEDVATGSDAKYQGPLARFYPGTDNTTIWLTTAYDDTTDNKVFFITRKLTQQVLVNGTNDATMQSAASGSGGILSSQSYTSKRASTAVGTAAGAYLWAISQVGTSTDILQLYVVSAGSASVKAIATSSATVPCVDAATDGNSYAFAPLAVWGEDGAYYVLYETHNANKAKGSSTCASTATLTSTGIYIQGYNSSGLVVYTTPAAVISAAPTAPTTMGTSMVTGAVGGGSNYTNSTYWLVTFRDATVAKTYFYTVGKTSGTATAIGPLADSGTGSSAIVYGNGGIVPGGVNGTYAFTVGQQNGATGSYTYNYTILVNGSATPALLGFTLASTASGYIPFGFGYRYSTGYAVVAAVPTAATTYVYTGLAFFANNTINTTANSAQTALGTYGAESFPPSFFVDANGSLWLGYGTADTSTGQIATASIAQIAANVNAYYPSAGNVLVTIAALLSFVIASLFMF